MTYNDRPDRVPEISAPARGIVQYHAAGTGRWAGRLLKPHNFPRPTLLVGADKMAVEK